MCNYHTYSKLKIITSYKLLVQVLEALIGCMLTVHFLRCLSLVKYLPRSYHLGLVLANAWKDVKIIRLVYYTLYFRRVSSHTSY